MGSRRGPLAFVVAVLGFVAVPPVAAQVPAGGEFQVNTFTTDRQWFPVVHSARSGDFVVVWGDMGGLDGSGTGIFGQRYGRDGVPLGSEFQVNTYTTGRQGYMGGLDISGDGNGRFVVVWTSFAQDGAGYGVFGQRFDSAGTRVGTEFQVNTFTTGHQGGPKQASVGVAQAPDGRFVVIWTDAQLGDGDVFARRFDAQGAPLGGEFQVSAYTTGYQGSADIAMDGSGAFVVVWMDGSGRDGSGAGAFGRRFDPAGNALGDDFQVNTYTLGNQSFTGYFGPSVARAATGEFLVVWQDGWTNTAVGEVYARRFDAAGVAVGSQFQLNTYTTGAQVVPTASVDGAGNFTVSWSSYLQDGSSWGIVGRRFDAAGDPRGAEFLVNTTTTAEQFFSEIGTDEVGNLVLAWTGAVADGSGPYDSFAQRFGGLFPEALAVDAAGNGVLDPGETAIVVPAWRNLNGASLPFGANAVLTGPGTASYTVPDPSADYGTVADGAAQQCSDCFSVLVSGARPASHWDATLTETISPDALGQTKPWTLHVGGSFADVPASHSFYRFVETMLHRGITAGCGGANYCPSNTTTRGQMAVFTLLGKEGSGYAPPACSPPNLFADVPETSPFCRYVEELANRGVVAGCGGGNFCPSSPVTRAQVPIFVLKTLDPSFVPPACGTPLFTDVPASSPFCAWIEELARRGVVSGCGGRNYCPSSPVTRGQMAVFVAGTFGLTLYGP